MLFEKNVLHQAVTAEIVDLLENFCPGEIVNSGYIYEVKENAEIDYLAAQLYVGKKYRIYNDDEDDDDEYETEYEVEEIEEMIDYVNYKKAIKIEGSKEMLINMIKYMQPKQKNYTLVSSFYGLLLSDGKGNFINPLHPIIAKSILEDGIPFETYKIIVFPFYNEVTKNISKEEFTRWEKVLEGISTRTKQTDIENNIDIKKLTREYIFEYSATRNFSNILNKEIDTGFKENEKIFTPVHTTEIDGITFPYYGGIVSYPMHGDSLNLFPQLTGNVNSLDIAADETSIGNDIYIEHYANTCIGEYSSNIRANYVHMNSQNCNSLYNERVLIYSWLTSVITGMYIASEILLNGEIK